jgi:F-type H+-transporting ATPase subunit a
MEPRSNPLEHPPILQLPGVPDHVTYTWLVMAILIVASLLATRRLRVVPAGLQNFMEIVLEQVQGLLEEIVGPEGRRFLPLIATLAMFILVSNLFGLIPGLAVPTANLNTTLACALIVFLAYHYIGIRKNGVWKYLKHFAGPLPLLAPLMFPIEVISHFARPLSLSVRLFANMFGGHMLMAALFFLALSLFEWSWRGSTVFFLVTIPLNLLPILLIVPIMLLKLLVALIQTFIFVMLSTVYISLALEEAEHH